MRGIRHVAPLRELAQEFKAARSSMRQLCAAGVISPADASRFHAETRSLVQQAIAEGRRLKRQSTAARKAPR